MSKKIGILLLSSNPSTTSRILVDEEAREISEKIQEGPHGVKFEMHTHSATRPADLQKLLMKFQPQIVHFSGHASKRQQLILNGAHGRGRIVDSDGLSRVFALHSKHVRLVLLNACFTKTQARSISEVVNYSIGTGRGIGDKAAVIFAGAFYRALGFGKCVKDAFESARVELALTKVPRSRGIELFVQKGAKSLFPIAPKSSTRTRCGELELVRSEEFSFKCEIKVVKSFHERVVVRG